MWADSLPQFSMPSTPLQVLTMTNDHVTVYSFEALAVFLPPLAAAAVFPAALLPFAGAFLVSVVFFAPGACHDRTT